MKLVKLRLFGFIVALLLLLPTLSVLAQGSNSPELSIFPEDLEINPGEDAEISIKISGADEINAFDISMNYDPDVIEILDSDDQTDGTQIGIGSFLEPDFVLINKVDPAAGTIRVVMTQINPSQPQSGDGTILVITFTATNPDQETVFEISNGILAKGTGEEIDTEPTSGTIRVAGSGTVYPTHTPTTPAPTATQTSPNDPTNTSSQAPTRTQTSAGQNTGVLPSRTPTRTPFPTAGASNTPLPTNTFTSNSGQTSEATETPTTGSSSQDQEGTLEQSGAEDDQEGTGAQLLADTYTEGSDKQPEIQSDDTSANESSQSGFLIAAEIAAFILLVVIIFYIIRRYNSRNNK
jgi:hypothetical protein